MNLKHAVAALCTLILCLSLVFPATAEKKTKIVHENVTSLSDMKPSIEADKIKTVGVAGTQSKTQTDRKSISSINYAARELLVKYKSGKSSSSAASYKTKGINTIKTFKKSRIQHISLPADLDVDQALMMLRNDPAVEFAQPNYIVHIAETTPDDTGFANLWGLHNTGQTVNGSPGTFDADMDLPEAWDITTGSSDIVVAVIDTGVNYNHPDLAGNVWTNINETVDGTDTDSNGKEDDIRGWDFVDGDNDPMDYDGHGTHCAGTIAGIGNNATGVAGVAWNVKIMPLRALGTLGFGLTSDIIDAIEYAEANGAHIISMSLGGTGGDGSAYTTAISSVSALVVAAAGNDTADNDATPHWPSSCPVDNVISVAATDQNDALADFSNYGETSVDVAAPGVNIYSAALPARPTVFSDLFNDPADPNLDPWTSGGTNNQWTVTGTIGGLFGDSYSLGVNATYSTNYPDNTNSWVESPTMDLSDSEGTTLEFYLAGEAEDGYDGLYIEVSTDNGSTYEGMGVFTGSTEGYWFFLEYDLKAYEGSSTVKIRFRFNSDSTVAKKGYYLEDIVISTHNSSETDSDEYRYLDGTSMATPNVAGVAALIKSRNPGLTSVEIKSIIESSVDTKAGLSEKCATGGRVNAFEALNSTPTPPNPTNDNDNDGYDDSVDCDDNNNKIYPNAPEICDGVDNQCPGDAGYGSVDEGVQDTYYMDADGDDYGDMNVTTQACSSSGSWIEDNTDCDDNNNKIYPNAPEICDGVDNQCPGDAGYGSVDESFILGESCTAGLGPCRATGETVCSADGLDVVCNAVPGQSTPEVCDDELDNDCDGQVNEGCEIPTGGGTTTPPPAPGGGSGGGSCFITSIAGNQ